MLADQSSAFAVGVIQLIKAAKGSFFQYLDL